MICMFIYVLRRTEFAVRLENDAKELEHMVEDVFETNAELEIE